jgi:hypothetical protein
MDAPSSSRAVYIGPGVSVFYPSHAPRRESATFRATKRYWRANESKCVVCGSAKRVEIHHCYIEWAQTNAVDWDRVRAAHPVFDWSAWTKPEDFIDSVYNTQPLCALHHRGPAPYGVHTTPGPIWNLQSYMRADYVYTPIQPPKHFMSRVFGQFGQFGRPKAPSSDPPVGLRRRFRIWSTRLLPDCFCLQTQSAG